MVMSDENETARENSGRKAAETKKANEAIARFAQYTAPVMLAMLASGGHSTPVAAQSIGNL
jgi:hypothetical protein